MAKSPFRQITLDFPEIKDYSDENFLVMPSNDVAYAVVKHLGQTSGETLVLYGEQGVGKTHLIHIAAQRLGVQVQQASNASMDWMTQPVLVVDDLQTANEDAQEILFHLFNNIKSIGGVLVVGGNAPAVKMDIIPELKSRLLTGHNLEIAQPNDNYLQVLLVKYAADRQLTLDPTVVAYLMKRCARNLSHMEEMIRALDRLSLEKKRRVTIPLAREALHDIDEIMLEEAVQEVKASLQKKAIRKVFKKTEDTASKPKAPVPDFELEFVEPKARAKKLQAENASSPVTELPDVTSTVAPEFGLKEKILKIFG
jgi:DnaA regulatory inactivator Hda